MPEALIIPSERIVSKIYVIRNKKVMLDRDIAELYGVSTRELNQAVKRNIKRFPADFMFQLDKQEFENWKSQIVISNSLKMGLRKRPLAFTEGGVAMLSGVLNSERAINVNIQIIRTFIKIRELLSTNEALQRKIMQMERKYDTKIKKIFDILHLLLADENKPVPDGGQAKKEIGF
jgi:hypothetical protein